MPRKENRFRGLKDRSPARGHQASCLHWEHRDPHPYLTRLLGGKKMPTMPGVAPCGVHGSTLEGCERRNLSAHLQDLGEG